MISVRFSIPCQSLKQAWAIKRKMDFALAGLFYNGDLSALFSSELFTTPDVKAAIGAVDRRKQLYLVKPQPITKEETE